MSNVIDLDSRRPLAPPPPALYGGQSYDWIIIDEAGKLSGYSAGAASTHVKAAAARFLIQCALRQFVSNLFKANIRYFFRPKLLARHRAEAFYDAEREILTVLGDE